MFWQPTRGILQPNQHWRRPQTPSGGSPTQVRVTFQAPATQPLVLDHASIGIQAGAGDAYDTAATPVELLFSGVSGFSISQGTSITSDWATLTISANTGTVYTSVPATDEGGWGSFSSRCIHSVTGAATPVVVIMDTNASGTFLKYVDGGTGDVSYYKTGASYATADETGFTGPYGSSRNYNVTSIETQ